jgi:hypothetical protein
MPEGVIRGKDFLIRRSASFESATAAELTRVEVAASALDAALPIQHVVGVGRALHIAVDQWVPAVAVWAVEKVAWGERRCHSSERRPVL